uniref:Stereocilin n=1 Tax=Apteryx owenii TaxID=8824 RepID=A0A8B9PK48_APTOW
MEHPARLPAHAPPVPRFLQPSCRRQAQGLSCLSPQEYLQMPRESLHQLLLSAESEAMQRFLALLLTAALQVLSSKEEALQSLASLLLRRFPHLTPQLFVDLSQFIPFMAVSDIMRFPPALLANETAWHGLGWSLGSCALVPCPHSLAALRMHSTQLTPGQKAAFARRLLQAPFLGAVPTWPLGFLHAALPLLPHLPLSSFLQLTPQQVGCESPAHCPGRHVAHSLVNRSREAGPKAAQRLGALACFLSPEELQELASLRDPRGPVEQSLLACAAAGTLPQHGRVMLALADLLRSTNLATVGPGELPAWKGVLPEMGVGFLERLSAAQLDALLPTLQPAQLTRIQVSPARPHSPHRARGTPRARNTIGSPMQHDSHQASLPGRARAALLPLPRSCPLPAPLLPHSCPSCPQSLPRGCHGLCSRTPCPAAPCPLVPNSPRASRPGLALCPTCLMPSPQHWPHVSCAPRPWCHPPALALCPLSPTSLVPSPSIGPVSPEPHVPGSVPSRAGPCPPHGGCCWRPGVAPACSAAPVPSCADVRATFPAAWSAAQLAAMDPAQLQHCLGLLSQDPALRPDQLRAVLAGAAGAVQLLGSVQAPEPALALLLGRLATQLGESELRQLVLSDWGALSALGDLDGWSTQAVVSSFLRQRGVRARDLVLPELVALGHLLCGLRAAEMQSLDAEELSKAAPFLGSLSLRCSEQQMEALAARLTSSAAFGPASAWGPEIFTEIGTLAAGLPDIVLSALVPEQIWALTPQAIAAIPAPKFAVVFGSAQLLTLSSAQASAVTPEQRRRLSSAQRRALASAQYEGEAAQDGQGESSRGF